MGSVEANRALYFRFVTLISRPDPDGLGEILSADFVDHSLPAETPPGPEGLKRFIAAHPPACPDRHATIEDLVAEGDRVVGRVSRDAVPNGPNRAAATTGRIDPTETIEIVRIARGRIAERWQQPVLITPVNDH